MPITEKQALRLAAQTIDSLDSTRARYEALCGLWLCYAYGEQWASVNANGGGFAVNQLRSYIKPNARKIRLSMRNNFV